MTHGGSGFTQGDDFVAARVSIDVPSEGIQSLREMSIGVNNLKASVEAGAKSLANYVQYCHQLEQAQNMAAEAGRNLAQQLEHNTELQQRSMGGGGAQAQLPMSRSAPQGYVDPWAGMGSGMGGQRVSSNTADQVQSQIIDPTRQLDPRKYINAQAGRYRIQAGDLNPAEMQPHDLDAAAGRVDARDKQQRDQEETRNPGKGQSSGGAGWGGLANNLMNEFTPGKGSHMGVASLAQRAFGAMGRMNAAAGPGASGTTTAEKANAGDAAGAEGGIPGLGAAFGMMGRAAGPLGVGLAALGAVEKGGAMYQGYKNMGLVRGGGAAEGMGDEMQIRTMALNPFLSNEQSRQIIMAGLTEGYSGKQFDTVTQFMASNLKDMNIQVSDSVQMLRKNVNEGGQSITGLTTSLGLLKEMSKTGAMSLPDMQQAFQQGTASEIGQGVSGGVASQDMLTALGAWGDDQTLKGQFAQMSSSAGSTAASGASIEAFGGVRVPGLNPASLPGYMSAHGVGKAQMSSMALKNLVKMLFKNYSKDSVQYWNMIPVFQQRIGVMFPGNPAASDQTMASEMVEKIRGGSDPFREGQQKLQQQTGAVNDNDQNWAAGGNVGEGLGAIGTTIGGLGRMFAAGVTGNDQAAINAADDIGKSWDNAGYNSGAESTNPVVSNIIGQYGASSVEVVGGDGQASALTGAKSQIQGLASGSLKWRRKGEEGGGITLAQTPTQMDQNFRTGGSGGGQTNVNFNPAQVQISFGSNGQMTATPNPVQLTPNQQAVNGGVGDNTMNNPPPGDGYGYWPGKSPGLR